MTLLEPLLLLQRTDVLLRFNMNSKFLLIEIKREINSGSNETKFESLVQIESSIFYEVFLPMLELYFPFVFSSRLKKKKQPLFSWAVLQKSWFLWLKACWGLIWTLSWSKQGDRKDRPRWRQAERYHWRGNAFSSPFAFPQCTSTTVCWQKVHFIENQQSCEACPFYSSLSSFYTFSWRGGFAIICPNLALQ